MRGEGKVVCVCVCVCGGGGGGEVRMCQCECGNIIWSSRSYIQGFIVALKFSHPPPQESFPSPDLQLIA